MRRRHRRMTSNPDLDITAFLNLMIVLVPVLLLGMVFTQIRMIELNFPGLDAGSAPSAEELALVVTLTESGIEVADSNNGLIRSLPNASGPDFSGLQQLLIQIKGRVPEKTDVVLAVPPSTDYQTLITAIDTLRSYDAVVAASVVRAELFPDVSLADPVSSTGLATLAPEVAQ